MTSAGFHGIDPDRLEQAAADLRAGADRLSALGEELGGKLHRYGIGTAAPREIIRIADWGRIEVSKLRERAELIRKLNEGGDLASPGGGARGLVRLPGELEDFELAQKLARVYGDGVFTEKDAERQAKLVHDHADEVAKLADDPQAAAAFYALLSPKVRDALPNLIAGTGSRTAKQDLAAFGKALGAALRAPALVPAFAKVRSDLTRPAGSKAAAWNRLALLAGANAPSNVRSAAARTLVLDDFARKPRQDWRAGSTESTAYGLPSDLVALGLEVLAGDGAAVRDAFSKLGGPEVKLTRPEKMKLFLDHAERSATGEDVADAFGRAMESGTEARTEQPGKHSPEAAAFTLDLMKVAGSFGANLPASAKDSMGVIAGSYVHELVSGARVDKAIGRASGVEVPEHWEPFPGVTPAFYLSLIDTSRFLKTFIGEYEAADTFDSAVARFRHDTLINAARLDAKHDAQRFEKISAMFGDFGGVAFKSAVDVLGEEDAAADTARDFVKNTAGFLLGEIPIANQAAELGWDAFQAYVFSGLSDDWADSFETQVEAVNKERSELATRLKYDTAHLLHSGGYPASEPPKELVSQATGGLKTYDELLAEAKREATGGKKWEQVLQEKLAVYEGWMDSNSAIDKKIEGSSRFQTSKLAEELLKKQDKS
ncbi:hypothetical protein [Planomonospora sp. ID82291]|uniref:hypothetical protein n=1 Tax=Planomonospora sp. ID82291 TaxID=2738136 RepID=UPI0018C3BE64|nr:hypothetical protein [Planomonospora sp. ID82291]MBG0815577.1 hypothetical protein [Planomonospora sp. ID82291]